MAKEADAGVGRALVADIAKWLVPSVTVLFGVVGFIAQTAQDGLLGLSTGDDSARYISSAADFFVSVITALVNTVITLSEFKSVSVAGFFWGLLAATAAIAVAILLPRLAGRFKFDKHAAYVRTAAWIVPLLTAVLLLSKFLYFDAPLLKVENVILGSSSQATVANTTADTGDLGKTFGERSHGTEQLISDRAADFWNEIVCSRVGDAIRQSGDYVPGVTCSAHQSDDAQRLKGEFLAELWLIALIVALAIVILRSARASHGAVGLAILALLYALTLPYAYGKLIKSTFYEYGRVRMAQTMSAAQSAEHRKDPGDGPPSHASGATAPPAPSDTNGSLRPVRALILARTPASTDLLVVKQWRCRASDREAERVTQMSLSPSQVLSIEEIYWQDVITWATLHQHVCQGEPAGHAKKQ